MTWSVNKRNGSWWVDCPEWEATGDAPLGPYDTKAEAEQDARGTARTMRDLEHGKTVQRSLTAELQPQVSNQDADARILDDIAKRKAQAKAERPDQPKLFRTSGDPAQLELWGDTI